VSLLEADHICEAYVEVHSREDAANQQQRQACFAEPNAVPAWHVLAWSASSTGTSERYVALPDSLMPSDARSCTPAVNFFGSLLALARLL
jgi:hypothetical protein